MIRRLLTALFAVLLTLAAAWISAGLWLPLLASWLDVGGEPVQAEYVFVLPGDERVRPFVAAAFVNAGLAHRVLVPRNAVRPDVADGLALPPHEIIRQVLVRRGVSSEQIIVLDTDTASTEDDAAALATFLERHPNARVAVVTSNYHTRRARWVLRRACGSRADEFCLISAPVEHFCIHEWWRSQEGFITIVSEYLKLAAFVAHSESTIGVSAVACAVVLILVCRRRRHGSRWRRPSFRA